MTHQVDNPESSLVELVKQKLRDGGKLLRVLVDAVSPYVPTDVSMAAFQGWAAQRPKEALYYPFPDSKIAQGLTLLIQRAVDGLVRDGACEVTGRGDRRKVQLLEEPPAAHADSPVVPESRLEVTAPTTDRASQIKTDAKPEAQEIKTDEEVAGLLPALTDEERQLEQNLLADVARPSHGERCQQRIQAERSRHEGRPVETHEATDLSPLDEGPIPDLTDPLGGVDLQRFRHYLRPHRPDEARKLSEAIAADGCRTPLLVGVLGGDKYLVDGFNRKGICEALGIPFEVTEVGFASEEEILAWMRANFDAGRNPTRTERNYYLGCDYLSEKNPRGGDRGNQHTGGKGKKVPFDSTAEAVAAKHRCSDKHVKNCARFARHLEEAVSCGLDFLKWPILDERIKYTRKLLDDLTLAGPGGCRAAIESLLAGNPDGQVTAGMVRKAMGAEDEAPGEEERPRRDPVELISETFDQAVTLADTLDDVNDLTRLIGSVEASLGRLRGILNNKRSKK